MEEAPTAALFSGKPHGSLERPGDLWLGPATPSQPFLSMEIILTVVSTS